ncbi:Mitochondrial distribution/morphology family 35/apoptosis [Phytophthora cinnamomi]|uniref:Mitochondrial distribution/morphology family 35/apoptosis n=1 Tax=Phytophthora cinnamomi TaxID=4785 RepID=UPI00355A41D9|nr:Mitochondrial distribution/morphology family 35/apoptosis [Phytophthora cinnamomi]
MMKMDAFAECEEQKERVKACYGDWFQRLWGGSFDRANCDQETQDYRQCVQDAMRRRQEQEKRKRSSRGGDNDYDWMDRTKAKSDEMAGDAKTRARKTWERAREEKEEAKGKVKSKASDVSSKVQETADSWADKFKGFAKKADSKTHDVDDDDDE